jgi:hypothetical protein
LTRLPAAVAHRDVVGEIALTAIDALTWPWRRGAVTSGAAVRRCRHGRIRDDHARGQLSIRPDASQAMAPTLLLRICTDITEVR